MPSSGEMKHGAVELGSLLVGLPQRFPKSVEPDWRPASSFSCTIRVMGSDSDVTPEPWSRREQILSTAAGLFWQNGFNATSMSELAAAVGIRKPSLYFYVDRKETLLYEISRESIRLSSEAVSSVTSSSTSPVAALAGFIGAHIANLLGEKSEMHATMLIDTRALLPADRDHIIALRDAYEELAGKLLRAGQKSGALRSDISEKMLRLSLFNLLNWTIFWFTPHGALSPFEVGGMLTTVFFDGVAATNNDTTETDVTASKRDVRDKRIATVSRFSNARLSEGFQSDTPRMQMLLAAASHFRSKGYAATTTRTLADALGMQKATLYHHFSRKSDVLYEISVAALSELRDRVSAELQAVTAAEERIPTLIRVHVQTALGIRDVYSTLATEFRALRGAQQQEVRKYRSEYRQILTEVIKTGQLEGIVRTDISAKNLSLVLLNLLGGTVLWYRPDGELNANEIARVYTRLFLSGAKKLS
jgi:TetR/AcrR family transcriptional regulator, cholesterol catabolism regulator